MKKVLIKRKRPNLLVELFFKENNKNLVLDKEYIRKRFLQIRSKQKLISAKNSQNNTTSTGTNSTFVYSFGKENKDLGTKEFTFTASKIPTEQEIIEHFNIDLSKCKISQIWHKTTPSGKYSISVNLHYLKGSEAIDYKKEFQEFVNNRNLVIFNNSLDKYWEKDTECNKEKNCTVVINLADLHLGKLVSEAETGERYNIDIAKERFLSCVKYLAQKSYQCYGVKKFILSTLGDTLHIDSLKSTTTAGTYVESDTRASKVFQTALDVITEAIEMLKQYAPEVEFININGNHCELSEQHLGIALKAYYRNDKQVIIDSNPRNRKYRLVGDNLLVWNHGDTNTATLPLTVATEQAERWGKSKFRLIQLGHLHSTKKKVYQSEDEYNGVIVRHFSSLSGTDAWHDKNNYLGSQKRGTALVFSDVEIGIVGEFYKTAH
jgi:hypothetical protein